MIYFYDGSKDAFLTALLYAFSDDDAVLTSGRAQLSLSQKTVFVCTDKRRAEKAKKRLLELDKDSMSDLDTLLRSGEEDRDTVALNYFKFLAKAGKPVRGMLAEDAVAAADACIRRVNFEVHRMHGFLRFMECESGALYAPCAPDADIVDLLARHFLVRLKGYPFVIHDTKRQKAAVSDGTKLFTAPLGQAEVVLSADEEAWQALWREYYKTVNIPSRERLKQMRGYMPVRYWKFLPEKNDPPN